MQKSATPARDGARRNEVAVLDTRTPRVEDGAMAQWREG